MEYAESLEANLADLHARVNAGTYRALPSRRKYIPKADGSQRPLGIAAIEDKIVQATVVAILTPIYKAEFLGFSYGFRPGRASTVVLQVQGQATQGRDLSTLVPLRALRSRTPDRACSSSRIRVVCSTRRTKAGRGKSRTGVARKDTWTARWNAKECGCPLHRNGPMDLRPVRSWTAGATISSPASI